MNEKQNKKKTTKDPGVNSKYTWKKERKGFSLNKKIVFVIFLIKHIGAESNQLF